VLIVLDMVMTFRLAGSPGSFISHRRGKTRLPHQAKHYFRPYVALQLRGETASGGATGSPAR